MARIHSRQVEAFRALMLTTSTVRAAEMLHISQPAVSRLVRDLQDAPPPTRSERRRVLRPADFAGEPFIALGPTTPSRFRIDDLFSRHGVERSIRVETPLSEIACALVASGVGLSIVDPFTAREYGTRGVVARAF